MHPQKDFEGCIKVGRLMLLIAVIAKGSVSARDRDTRTQSNDPNASPEGGNNSPAHSRLGWSPRIERQQSGDGASWH